MNGDREKCFDAGMDDYISKPVHLKDLLEIISRIKKANTFPSNMQNCVHKKTGANSRQLFEKFGGDKDQLSKCLKLFEIELPALFQAVESSILMENVEELKNACHDFRGVLMTMEMHKASSIILQMEALANKKKFRKVNDLYRSLKDAITYSIEYLESAT